MPLKMNADQQPQKSSTKPTDGIKNDISETIAIIGVTCSTTDKSLNLKSGVVKLLELYFEELYKLGCDLGFLGF